jgi:hypothetical protein
MITDETKSRGHGDKRSRKLDQFIAALLANSSVEAAAQATQIGRATAHRWLQDPDVVQRLAEARRDAMKAAMSKLQQAASTSVDCLCEIQREGESESARVSAARCILEQALRAAELGDIEERLAKLETIAKGRNWKGAGAEQPLAASGNRGVNGHA